MKCATCKKKECYIDGKDCTGKRDEFKSAYVGDDKAVHYVAAEIEAKHYMKYTRLEEIIEFSRKMRYGKLGIAFCIGLEKEAQVLSAILEKDFEIESVCCKVCGIDKGEIGLPKIEGGNPERRETMCNPITQAKLLNQAGTDLNIVLGLCVGHDILFSKYSQAPLTTFAVKDRVLGHNPLAAVYTRYYRKKNFGLKE
ncbi:MAG: DUF1847 domain-containing protein [Candidatus Micrarchaeota archaeon]